MLFNSLTFLAFATVYFPVHFAVRGNIRIAWAMVASYFFYGWWDWRFLPLIMLSTAINYAAGLLIGNARPQWRKTIVCIAVTCNLGILALFKYFDFFIASLQIAFASIGLLVSPGLLNLVLPIGISFYTFHGISYVIDVYSGSCRTERNPLRFAAYIALFPQLVAGPIVRASRLLPQMIIDQPFDLKRVLRGIELVIIGFALKLIVADNLAAFVDASFSNVTDSSGAALALATLFFTFQIYGDFAGYSLIAIGLGVVMGYDFGENFRRPYLATSFSDFWQRWHISLSSWLRDYLYIPLGGNRSGGLLTARNLFIVMFLGGLWHGANWTFVIWGLLHATYLVLQRGADGVFPASRRHWVSDAAQIIAVFLAVNFAWIFFRSQSLADALLVIRKIATGDDGTAALADRLAIVRNLLIICALMGMEIIAEYRQRRGLPARFMNPWLRAIFLLVLLWLIASFGAFEGSEFVYFQF
ncbi:MAG: MBOAT family protein [Ferrovibrio sp.]|uniref:MBOAT family O-acyltransferase n=1 Tax=Ferrovibrio sp. TaxID=1917215 RepID=UPI00262F61BA|nr:MBOAT family O-acyltransferase [Ferrovibrio sp.]MCW0234917.1 MBOAT family protein [Ferrovibrio sp.]